MTRLDRHILAVRNRLTLREFVQLWAAGLLYFAIIVWLAIAGEKALNRILPHGYSLLLAGLLATILAATAWSILHRPSAEFAAIAIDHELQLKEKFSSAVYASRLDDPFARAVVLDAQQTAENVSLHRRFPLGFPPSAGYAAAIFIAALLTAWLVPPLHLLATPTPPPTTIAHAMVPHANDQLLKDQLPRIEQGAKLLTSNDTIQRATADLDRAAHTTEGDDLHSRRSALSALQDYQKAIKEELEKNQEFQNAQTNKEALSQIQGATDTSTPMGKAQNEIKNGDLDSAMNDISKAIQDFNKLPPEQQQKILQQAQQLAQQLSHAANDPATGQKIAQQLMQMGASQSMAQSMSAAMQQAASGDKQSQQQLQQMAQQIAQQMNNGQGPSQQQQQQIQKMMTKSQAMANSQAQAGALSQAMQQLAQAMQQAKAAQQAQGTHPGQRPSPGQAQGNQQMAQAGQNVQQQLQQIQAQAKDAQEMKAAADASAAAAADAAAGLNSGGGSGQDQSMQNGSNLSNSPGDGMNNPNGRTNPMGPPGQANGGNNRGGEKNPDMEETPYHMQQVIDPSKDIGGGKILASRYVKAGIDPGQSTAGLRDAAVSGEQEETQDIDQDHVSRDAQQAVKDYFSSIQQSGQ
jgi:chemotaxis protein histidine kinase CheA